MNIKIMEKENDYILKINYKVSLSKSEVWKWIATTEGFSKWFPQLHMEIIDKEYSLIFKMENFREEMKVQEYKEFEKIKYQWDKATVSFTVTEESENGTYVSFEERIPKNYENAYGDAVNDMAGWSIHNERLSYMMNGEEAPQISTIKTQWEDYINNAVRELEKLKGGE